MREREMAPPSSVGAVPVVEALETSVAKKPESAMVQRALAVGRSDDPSEREADRVADQVMRQLSVSKPFSGSGNSRIRRKESSAIRPGGTVLDAPVPGRIAGRISRPAVSDQPIRREIDTTAVKADTRAAPLATEQRALRPAHHQTAKGLSGDTDKDLAILFEQANVAYPELQAKTKDLARLTRGKPKFPPGLKAPDTAKDKVIADYGGKAAKIVDLVRATVGYDTFADMLLGLKQCNEGFVKIVRQNNRYASPTKAGYRDICLNVQLSNGHVGELQLNLNSMMAIKDPPKKPGQTGDDHEDMTSGHVIYEKIRKIEASYKDLKTGMSTEIPPEERAKLDALYKASLELYKKAPEAKEIEAYEKANAPKPKPAPRPKA